MHSLFLTSWPTLATAMKMLPRGEEMGSLGSRMEFLERARQTIHQPLREVGESIRREWQRQPTRVRQIQQLEIDLVASISLLSEDLSAKPGQGAALRVDSVMKMVAQIDRLGTQLFGALSAMADAKRETRSPTVTTSSSSRDILEPFVDIELGPAVRLIPAEEEVRPRCPFNNCTLL